MLNSIISSTCSHNTVNFGPLAAEIGLPVWRTHQISTDFASWLRYCSDIAHRRSTKLLHDDWPSPGLVHYIFGGFCPWRNFATCKIHVMSKSCVLLYWQRYFTALQQQASAKLCGVVQGIELRNFRRMRHLYLAGQTSRWASAHIVVFFYFLTKVSNSWIFISINLLVQLNNIQQNICSSVTFLKYRAKSFFA